ncbi:MAG: 16S rRNA (uracil(1498)-N(3))-methyltransferase [Bacteroidetes bacterium]|nr:16S rRNA (uracil(1498)-N(3))-methyltransferase [Bacteroidota bacterium]
MAQFPYFYIPSIVSSADEFALDEDTSKHVVQVLRMKKGETLQLTDGIGNLLIAKIVDDHKKKCIVKKEQNNFHAPYEKKISIAVSLLKNTSRFEWFLEKATEIGVAEIIPLLCERTEKQHFRLERMKNILISAMLQSQQCWLPFLHEPVSFKKTIHQSEQQQKFIAHCVPGNKSDLSEKIDKYSFPKIILIGPEGDFTDEEISTALEHHFTPVALGETRLRSETAAIVAATILKMI